MGRGSCTLSFSFKSLSTCVRIPESSASTHTTRASPRAPLLDEAMGLPPAEKWGCNWGCPPSVTSWPLPGSTANVVKLLAFLAATFQHHVLFLQRFLWGLSLCLSLPTRLECLSLVSTLPPWEDSLTCLDSRRRGARADPRPHSSFRRRLCCQPKNPSVSGTTKTEVGRSPHPGHPSWPVPGARGRSPGGRPVLQEHWLFPQPGTPA